MESLAEVLENLQTSSGGSKPASLSDIVAFERKKAEWYNQSTGNMTGYDCPICLNRGDFLRVDDDGYTHHEECECMAKRRSLRRLKRSGLDENLTLENWQTLEPWQRGALESARDFSENPAGWFFVSGNPGTGKTHLCAGLCRLLIDRGLETRYMLWRDVVVRLNAAANDGEAFARIMEPLQTVRVLYIDDFFKTGGERPSTGEKNRAFEIINARYNDRRLITVISSEWDSGALMDIDEAIGSRIYQRAGEFNLDFTGKPNWRRR